jgi:glc operon protein GlcG
MYKKEVFGLEEARKAVRACIEKASKDPSRPVSVAVVDEAGNPICFERMDGSGVANGKTTSRMAYNKAYTAIMMNRHTRDFNERMKQLNAQLTTWGDPAFTDIPGGLVWKNAEGQVVGAIGVSGLLAHEDEELAYVGLNAVKI